MPASCSHRNLKDRLMRAPLLIENPCWMLFSFATAPDEIGSDDRLQWRADLQGAQ